MNGNIADNAATFFMSACMAFSQRKDGDGKKSLLRSVELARQAISDPQLVSYRTCWGTPRAILNDCIGLAVEYTTRAVRSEDFSGFARAADVAREVFTTENLQCLPPNDPIYRAQCAQAFNDFFAPALFDNPVDRPYGNLVRDQLSPNPGTSGC